MATTYKFLTNGTEELFAQVFGDDIEIYDGSRLDPCTFYVWYHDDLLGNDDSITIVQGATQYDVDNGDATVAAPRQIDETDMTMDGRRYQVDLSDVGNSGEYWCQIRVGTTQDCWLDTERRRISIIECLDQTDRTFSATGASGSFRVRAPHYEMPIFNNEGAAWIMPMGLITCDTQTENVCLFVQNFTLADQAANSNSARRAQPTITIGPLVCFYNVVQDYIQAPPAPPSPDIPPGPFINLSQNGPAITGSPITVTAMVGTVGGTGTETYTVAWQNATVNPTNDLEATVAGATAGTTTVTATVTSSTGGTATETISVVHEAPRALPATVTGQTIAVLASTSVFGRQPRVDSTGTINVSGGNTFFARLTMNPRGYFGGRPGVYSAELTLTGPGVNATEVISSTFLSANTITREIQFNGTGTYNWRWRWIDGETRPTGTGLTRNTLQSIATLTFAGQLF